MVNTRDRNGGDDWSPGPHIRWIDKYQYKFFWRMFLGFIFKAEDAHFIRSPCLPCRFNSSDTNLYTRLFFSLDFYVLNLFAIFFSVNVWNSWIIMCFFLYGDYYVLSFSQEVLHVRDPPPLFLGVLGFLTLFFFEDNVDSVGYLYVSRIFCLARIVSSSNLPMRTLFIFRSKLLAFSFYEGSVCTFSLGLNLRIAGILNLVPA